MILFNAQPGQDPDINVQYFNQQDVTWQRPERAATTDVIVQVPGAAAPQVKRFSAPDIPPSMRIETTGRDGYALIITHLAETGA